MKIDISKIIEIPKGVEVVVEGNTIIIKGKEGESKRTFKTKKISFEVVENQLKLESKGATKREKKMMNTIAAHINNMIKGVDEKFEYKLKICISHFPITIEIEGNEAIIKNFLGERIPRKVKILENVEVKIDKDIISVLSIDRELAGQTAANFEKATLVKSRDRRVFQDGIFITDKPRREL